MSTSEMQSSSALEFMKGQVFVVDPRAQGFGLAEYGFLDGYSSKFFLLADSESVFVSPSTIPPELLRYYRKLGLDIPTDECILTVSSSADGVPISEQLVTHPTATDVLAAKRGRAVVPYMVTPEVDALAADYGLSTLARSSAVSDLADKTVFQRFLLRMDQEIESATGLSVSIPFGATAASDRNNLRRFYNELSRDGSMDVVVIRPKSASALGLFVLKAERGVAGLEEILDSKFDSDEEVLLEAYVPHNHAPSMQGAKKPGGLHQHLYFGRQLIATDGENVSYEGNQIPFGPNTVSIRPEELGRLRQVHQIIGERAVDRAEIGGISGVDLLMTLSPDGTITAAKATEMNLHLPSSLAIYAAITKLFPEGFEGIAHNIQIPLNGRSVGQFMNDMAPLLVVAKNHYGVFPIDMSYTDKADIVIFARNLEHLERLLAKVQK